MQLRRDNRIKAHELFVDEAIFANQNRWLGIRGNFEEGVPYQDTVRGTYINGYYDTHTIEYGERAYGFPDMAQTIVNLPDAQTIYFVINGKTLNLSDAKLIDLKRTYDLKQGFTKRQVVYELERYGRFTLTFVRRTHLVHTNLFINQVSIKSDRYQGEVKVVSTLNGDVENYISKSDPRMAHKHQKKLTDPMIKIQDDYALMMLSTRRTQLGLCVGITHSEPFVYLHEHGVIRAEKTIVLEPKKPYRFTKYAVYHSSQETLSLEAAFDQSLKRINDFDDEALIAEHQRALDDFNHLSRVDIDSDDPHLNETIAYNLYQLYTAGAANSSLNIPAKGLTGEGYEGHTFWDTEIYLIPYFMQVSPTVTKNLLIYRYHQLPNAKNEARLLGVSEGAKFAWRTINGDEASAYYPAGTAQYHINSDIAYTIIHYYKLYRDEAFMRDYGFEILLETARFFKHVVHKHNGKFHLHHVTGPDEYTAVVDNNYYTNSLLKYHLSFLINYIEKHSIAIAEEELEAFKAIRDDIVLLHDSDLEIDVQDQSFLSKKVWDFSSTPKAHHPLLLHYHPLTIYRHQVLKQPDTVLSHVLLNNRPTNIQLKSFEYYEKLTTHDSSLSYCIHALQAARLGQLEKAYDYFQKIVSLDIDNLHGNTQFGLHLANLGGVYLALLKGFIGYHHHQDGIKIYPRIPAAWRALKMMIRVQSETMVEVYIKDKTLSLSATDDVKITVYDKTIQLKKGQTTSLPLRY